MAETAYVTNRYGAQGGQCKVKSSGKHGAPAKYRDTAQAMSDKCRYNQTRFAGESNAMYDEHGDVIEGGHTKAYERTSAAAEELRETGGNKGRAYIYDTTVNPGLGVVSDEQAHRWVQALKEELERDGHRVEGLQYTIHQNTNHTHVHVMYATQKTLQKKTARALPHRMREHADRIHEQHQIREATREQATRREVDNTRGHNEGVRR